VYHPPSILTLCCFAGPFLRCLFSFHSWCLRDWDSLCLRDWDSLCLRDLGSLCLRDWILVVWEIGIHYVWVIGFLMFERLDSWSSRDLDSWSSRDFDIISISIWIISLVMRVSNPQWMNSDIIRRLFLLSAPPLFASPAARLRDSLLRCFAGPFLRLLCPALPFHLLSVGSHYPYWLSSRVFIGEPKSVT
jgi:hypothetical protein